MAMRLQELHPALVHLPLALFPASLAADLIGSRSANPALLQAGRLGILAATGGALASAITGAIAQQTSTFDQDSRDLLVTHRTLNLGLISVIGGMAAHRLRGRSPGPTYLAIGAAAMGLMTYSAYLGGVMVYQKGIGVDGRGTLRRPDAPYLEPERSRDILRTAASHLREGLRDVVLTMARGELVPALTRRRITSTSTTEYTPVPEVSNRLGRGAVDGRGPRWKVK